MVGQYGGAAFIIVYILCCFLLSLPIFLSESIIGRRGGADIYAPGLYEKENARSGADLPSEERTVTGTEETLPSHLGYWIPAAVLTGLNLYLGLFSWQIVGLLEKGIAMFS